MSPKGTVKSTEHPAAGSDQVIIPVLLADGQDCPACFATASFHPVTVSTLRPADITAMAQDTGMIVLLPSPIRDIVARMQAGYPPSEALAAWALAAETLMAPIRRIRRQVTSLETDLAQENPNACATLVRQAFGPGLQFDTTVPATPPLPQNLFHLSALALAGDAAAAALADEIEATVAGPTSPRHLSVSALDAAFDAQGANSWAQRLSCSLEKAHADLPPGAVSTVYAVEPATTGSVYDDAVQQDLFARIEAAQTALVADLAQMMQERDLLVETLEILQDEIEQEALRRSLIEAEHTGLTSRLSLSEDSRQQRETILAMQIMSKARALETAAQTIASKDATLNKQANRLKWLGVQSRRSASRIKTLEDKLVAAEKLSAATRDALNESCSELDRLYGSKSWRMTAPIRAANSLFDRQ